MHACEFCHTQFTPRPQVKNPRACSKIQCQKKRQSTNEKAWRSKHLGRYDKSYYELKKDQRLRTLEKKATKISACLEVGMKFHNHKFDVSLFHHLIEKFFIQCGLKTVNKFWNENFTNVFKPLTAF